MTTSRQPRTLLRADHERPLTALTYYVCRNHSRCPLAPPEPGIDELRYARQIRERLDTGKPLHPPAAVCDCGQPRTRLADTAQPEPAETGRQKIRDYLADLRIDPAGR